MTLLLAEDVLPGHPDRVADAIAESIVDEALRIDPDALVGVEVAVHRDSVFVTGRVAVRPRMFPAVPIEAEGEECLDKRRLKWIVHAAFQSAGYTGGWAFPPRVTRDLDIGDLDPEERAIRGFSDDQNICVGHAAGSEATGFLPPAVHAVRRVRVALTRLRDVNPRTLGPDGKVLVGIDRDGDTFRWRLCNVALQHADGVGYEELHRLALPVLAAEARALDGALPGLAESWDASLVRLNGAGNFSCGGTHGDNGLSGKKLAVDHYGSGVPIGGGALCGKDPHKVDRVGALIARQLAVRIVRDTGAPQATVTLCYLPGLAEPAFVVAEVGNEQWDLNRIRAAIAVPDLGIEATFQRLELARVKWANELREGYFGNGKPWER